MSDDTGRDDTRPDEQADEPSAEEPQASDGSGGAESPATDPTDSAGEPAGDAPEPGPEISDEAAAALRAAQEAVAQAMGGGVSADADAGDEAAVEAAKQTVAEVGKTLGAGLPADGDPTPVDLPTFDRVTVDHDSAEMRLLGDVNVDVRIELGRTRMLVEDVLRLSEGAVVELEKLAGDPVDVYVNGRHVARGEVLVLNENFCIRVNEVVEPGPVSQRV